MALCDYDIARKGEGERALPLLAWFSTPYNTRRAQTMKRVLGERTYMIQGAQRVLLALLQFQFPLLM